MSFMVTNIELERKKAYAYLAGDPHISLKERRDTVRLDKEKLEGEKERKKEKAVKEIKNPRLRTEAYLRKIGKL